jgi:hypothetical protein
MTGCANNGSNTVALTPGQYGNLNISGGTTVQLPPPSDLCTVSTPCIYNINSINVLGNSSIMVTSGPVIINVAGSGQGIPINLGIGTIVNSNLNSANFQIQYAGTGIINLAGGNQTAAVVDAPNAPIIFSGNATWYGAVIGSTIDDSGGAPICYDRALETQGSMFTSVANYMLESFTWEKF